MSHLSVLAQVISKNQRQSLRLDRKGWCWESDSYRKNSKYWDMYVWANSVDSDQTALKEQSDQDLHCLPFFLHLLEA